MDKNTEKALAAIKTIAAARTLRSFRKKIYVKTDLTYGEAILAQRELIAKNELVKTAISGNRYKLARPSNRHYSFKEFLLSITNESTCSDEIREILLNAGLFNENDAYKYLKELVFHLKHDLLIGANNFSFSKSELLENLYKGHFTPFFAHTSLKNSFFSYQATVPSKALDTISCVDKNATKALLFGYPIYTDGKGNYTPIFCNAIDNVEQNNEDCYLKKLKNDKYLINSCFIKLIAHNKGYKVANELLVKLHQTPQSDFDKLENLEISKAEIPLENALLLVSNVVESVFNSLNPQVLSNKPLEDEQKNNEEFIFNKAVIVPINEKEPFILYKLAQLEQILRLNEKELDKTALSCFSSRQVINNEEIKLFEDLVIGKDYESDLLQGASPIILCNALSKENSLMYVAEDFDYETLCEYAKRNLMLSNSIGAIVSYKANAENLNKTSAFFEKDDDYNLDNDYYSLYQRLSAKNTNLDGGESSIVADYKKYHRALEKDYDIAFNQALVEEELKLISSQLKELGAADVLKKDTILLSKYARLRDDCQKILSKYYTNYRENKLSSFDVAKFNFANFFFIRNSVTKLCKIKSPNSVEALKDFIHTVKLFNKYLKLSYENARLKSIEAKLLQSVNKANYKELKECTESLHSSLQEPLLKQDPKLLYALKQEYFDYHQENDLKALLSVYSPVCEFASINDVAKSLFIPGIFDKTLMLVDKSTNIADLILALAKTKSVSIIVRKNSDCQDEQDPHLAQNSVTPVSLIDNLSVDENGLISMYFNQKKDEDIALDDSIATTSIERFIPYLKAQNLEVVRKDLEKIELTYLEITGFTKTEETNDCTSNKVTDSVSSSNPILILSQIDKDNLLNADSFNKGDRKWCLEYFDESLFKLNAKTYAKEFADKYKSLF